MNEALGRLATQLQLDAPSRRMLRLEFGHDCVLRVAHLLEEPAVVDCLARLGRHLDGALDAAGLAEAAAEAARLANHHQGSRSIDGCGHAAVSATYAVANALAGRALQAADYAAYAMVYGQGGYGAVAERASFEPEFDWQVRQLAQRAQSHAAA